MQVTKHRKARSLKHKIHMPDGIWTYRIGCKRPGGGGGATIRNPDCTLTGKINMPELTGWSWDNLERARWKKTPEPQVKPSDIRLLIEKIQKGVYEIRTTSTPKKKAQVAQRQRRTAQNRVSEGSNPSLGI